MAVPADAASPARLAKAIEEYLADHPMAALLEDGRILFDMRTAHYSVSEQHGRCLLHFWSDERNLIRTITEVQPRASSFRLVAHRMGAARAQTLQLIPTSDRRTPTVRDAARRNYKHLLERVLARSFLGAKPDGFRSAMDLEHSFGPAYIRGRLYRGTAADAVIGVSETESPAIIDGILTLGILWLEHCRQKSDRRRHFGGLKVILPKRNESPSSSGKEFWRLTAERMAWLNHAVAELSLFTLDERSEEFAPVDFRDIGNIDSRLVHAFSPAAAIERCQPDLDRLLALVPPGAVSRVEVHATSTTQVGLLLHGLEFARVRRFATTGSFARESEISFGAGLNETPLTPDNEPLCRDLFARLFASRHPGGETTDPLFRLQPERWLESRLRSSIAELLPNLRADLIYSQVPALSAGQRGMLDLLALDRNNRLCVIELKADEDLHLPLQALDYWIRVRALNDDRKPAPGNDTGPPQSAFERQGYFAGAEISTLPPRLILAAPALRIHPANETVIRYLSPEVDWELVALSEHWRQELKVVFRKRAGPSQS